jgi:hypothetical protein
LSAELWRLMRRLLCGAVGCGTTLLDGRTIARQGMAFRHTQRRDLGGERFFCRDAEETSFAEVQMAAGKNRGTGIFLAAEKPGWKIVVRVGQDAPRARPGAAARRFRTRPCASTSPRRWLDGRRCRADRKSPFPRERRPDAVSLRSASRARGSTCHGRRLSSWRRRGSPLRAEWLPGRRAAIGFEGVPEWFTR